jgi:gluconate 2-dehydrogenase gamma chain
MAEVKLARRNFLKGAGAAGAASAAMATGLAACGPEAATAAAVQPAPEVWHTLNATEAAFIKAAVDTLVPADDLTPSGSDVGLATFIDRQLAGAFGNGARLYRSGPFLPGKPEHGYQLALTPREFFRAGIEATNEWTRKAYSGRDFDRLNEMERAEAMKALEEGKPGFAGFRSSMFFEQLLQLTMEGFFADPIYGGNRDKVAWKMIGFPGLPASYREEIKTYFNKRYDAEPQSIADFS